MMNNMLRMLRTRHLVVGLCIALTGCSVSESPEQARSYSLSGLADLDPSTRSWVDSVLSPVAEESRSMDRLLNGDLHLFGSPGGSPRFLVDVQGTPFGEEREIYLIVLDRSLSNGRSAPFSTGVLYDEFNYEPLSVEDVDGDDVVDFIYCTWPDSANGGRENVVGYLDSWHTIDAESQRQCGPRAIP